MEKNRTFKTIAIVALLLAVTGIGVAFAALSTTLNIIGSAKVNGPDWNIRFENLGTQIVTGAGTVEGTPVLTDTAITNIKAVFNGDGSVAYEFDVTNDGVLDAKIGTLTLLATPTCTGTGTNQTTDESLVCSSISTSLTYVIGGADVAVGDTLAVAETKKVKFTVTYSAGALHPDNPVDVTGLGATIVYVED